MKRHCRNLQSEISNLQSEIPLAAGRSPLAAGGFTLVELLVVMTIIGILAAMTVAAVLAVRRHAQDALIVNDLMQLDMACKAYKEKFGEYPPDGTDMNAVARHIRTAFPNSTQGTAALPITLNPQNSLVFWLGGMQDDDGVPCGFAADATKPFQKPKDCAARIGPLFQFDQSRLKKNEYKYWPQGAAGTTTGAITYFRADNGSYYKAGSTTESKSAQEDCKNADGTTGVVYPAQDSRLGADNSRPWVNPKSFQIFSAGRDMEYDSPGGPINFPSGEAGSGTNAGKDYGAKTYDDCANFNTKGTLGEAVP
jgi:prepilin-type N-terminal cleavage/methylation domain-containing protein